MSGERGYRLRIEQRIRKRGILRQFYWRGFREATGDERRVTTEE